jgi:hypothetical protein
MARAILGLILLLSPGALGRTQHTNVTVPSGAWLESRLLWNSPPAELGYLHEHYAEAGILFFAPDHQFLLVYGTVLRQPNRDALSQGDGRVVYSGTWKGDRSGLHVEYRIVERTVRREGEQIPGPILSRDIQVVASSLIFEGKRFSRDARLDHDLQAALEGSTARAELNGQ